VGKSQRFDAPEPGGAGISSSKTGETHLVSGKSGSDSLRSAVLWTVAGVFAARLVGFARSLWLVARLPDAELGRWAIVYSVLPVAAWLLTLGVPAGLARYLPGTQDSAERRRLVRLAFFVCLLPIPILCLLIHLFPRQLALVLFGDPRLSSLGTLAAFATGILLLSHWLQGCLHGLLRFRHASVLQMIHTLAFAVLAVLLVELAGATAAWALAAHILAGILAIAWGCWIVRAGLAQADRAKATPTAIGKERLPVRSFLAFSIGLCVAGVVEDAWSLVDRFAIVHAYEASAAGRQAIVGQYHIAFTLASPLALLLGLFGTVLLPYAASAYDTLGPEEGRRRIDASIRMASVGFLVASLPLCLFGRPFAALVLGRDEGLWCALLPWTVAAAGMSGVQHIYKAWFACRGHPWRLAALWGATLAGNAVTSVLLVRRLGPVGPAIATVLWAMVSGAVLHVLAGGLKRPGAFRTLAAVWLPCLAILPGVLLVVVTGTIVIICFVTNLLWSSAERDLLLAELAELGFGGRKPRRTEDARYDPTAVSPVS